MDRFKRHAGIIGWAIVMIVVIVALFWQHTLSQRIESESRQRTLIAETRSQQRAHILCTSQNETREAIGTILDILAAPREDDEEGDFEARQELRVLTQDVLEPENCPPIPDLTLLEQEEQLER